MKSSGVLKEILITEASKTIKYRDCRIVIHKEKGGYSAYIFDDLGTGTSAINKNNPVFAKTQKRARDMAESVIDGKISDGYMKDRD